MTLIRAKIQIEDDAWVCAEAFVGPNVVVGAGAIVGARAAVFADVPPWVIVRGNPAQFFKARRPLSYSGKSDYPGNSTSEV